MKDYKDIDKGLERCYNKEMELGNHKVGYSITFL